MGIRHAAIRKTLLSVFVLVGHLCTAAQPAQRSPQNSYISPEALNDGIKTASLKSAGLDEAKIIAGIEAIRGGAYPNIHSILIFRDGKLVLEEYFTGEDIDRGAGRLGVVKHSRETLHDLRSVTKSVIALGVLIAHAQGKIKNLDQPIFDFFPEYARHADEAKKQITVKHVLSMSAGLFWDEDVPYTDPTNSEIQMNRSSDPIDYVLSQKLIVKPGTVWNYSGGCTQLLAAIIKSATGSEADIYVEKNLFTPLGITKYRWAKTRSGHPSAASGLRLRSRDMAKVGLLLVNNGKWNGKRILPEDLVAEAMAEHSRFEYPEGRKKGVVEGYGYQMWHPTFPVEGGRFALVAFAGNGGQRVEIDRENKAMLVVTAGNYDKPVSRSSSQIYEDIVYPAILRKATRNRGKETAKD